MAKKLNQDWKDHNAYGVHVYAFDELDKIIPSELFKPKWEFLANDFLVIQMSLTNFGSTVYRIGHSLADILDYEDRFVLDWAKIGPNVIKNAMYTWKSFKSSYQRAVDEINERLTKIKEKHKTDDPELVAIVDKIKFRPEICDMVDAHVTALETMTDCKEYIKITRVFLEKYDKMVGHPGLTKEETMQRHIDQTFLNRFK